MKTLLVVDVETTGLHPDRNYPIQLGLVVLNLKDGTKVLKWKWDIALPSLVEVLRPEFWRAKKVHGKTVLQMLRGQDRSEVLRDLDFIRALYPSAPLAGHNAQFDALFVRRLYELSGRESPFDYHTVDLSTLGQVHLGVKSLSKIAASLGVGGERSRHDALADADLTADCFVALFKRLDPPHLFRVVDVEDEKRRAARSGDS